MHNKYTISGGPEQGVEQGGDDGLTSTIVSWIGPRRWRATSAAVQVAEPRAS